MSRSEPVTLPYHKQGRPFLLYLLGLILLAITVIAIYRLAGALKGSALFALVNLPVSLQVYLAGSGLLWTLSFLPALWGLTWRKPWSVKATWAATLFYLGSYWLERLFLWQPEHNQGTWLFYATLSVFWIMLTFITFKLHSTRRFLHHENELIPERNNP
jgi:hypothetical protein